MDLGWWIGIGVMLVLAAAALTAVMEWNRRR